MHNLYPSLSISIKQFIKKNYINSNIPTLSLQVIIATSLVWFLLDVFLLMYFTDCTMNSTACDKSPHDGGGNGGGGAAKTAKPGGFLNRILPNGE